MQKFQNLQLVQVSASIQEVTTQNYLHRLILQSNNSKYRTSINYMLLRTFDDYSYSVHIII